MRDLHLEETIAKFLYTHVVFFQRYSNSFCNSMQFIKNDQDAATLFLYLNCFSFALMIWDTFHQLLTQLQRENSSDVQWHDIANRSNKTSCIHSIYVWQIQEKKIFWDRMSGQFQWKLIKVLPLQLLPLPE